jgi:hypothetical protein
MQENDDRQEPKHPIDMTSDELLDYALAPEVAEQVKRLAKPQDDERPADCEPKD